MPTLDQDGCSGILEDARCRGKADSAVARALARETFRRDPRASPSA